MSKQKKQEFYEVKEVLDLMIKDGKQFCQVWWKNYPRVEATWEPIQNMIGMKNWDKQYKRLKKKAAMSDSQNSEQIYDEEAQKSGKKSVSNKSVKKIERVEKTRNIRKKESTEREKLGNTNERVTRLRAAKKQSMMEEQSSLMMKYSVLQSSQSIFFSESKSPDKVVKEESMKKKSIPSEAKQKAARPKTPSLNKHLYSSYSQHSQYSSYSSYSPHKSGIKRVQGPAQLVRYKGRKIQLYPVTIDLQVAQSNDQPFLGKQVQHIKSCFMRQGEMMYEVQFRKEPIKQTIIMHNKYLKLLWPRKLAQYLLQKVKSENRFIK